MNRTRYAERFLVNFFIDFYLFILVLSIPLATWYNLFVLIFLKSEMK